jgi:hypothetical protein
MRVKIMGKYRILTSHWDILIFDNDVLIAGYDRVIHKGFINEKRYGSFIGWADEIGELTGENLLN